jgi:hypothetical protein
MELFRDAGAPLTNSLPKIGVKAMFFGLFQCRLLITNQV